MRNRETIAMIASLLRGWDDIEIFGLTSLDSQGSDLNCWTIVDEGSKY